MKKSSAHRNLLAALTLTSTAIGVATIVFAAEQKQARVTEIIHDVRLLAGQAAARPATVNDTVHEGTAVRTGTDSRAELTFLDQTLTRLGANTIFSFGAGARTYDLGSGAILMTAPKGAGTVRVSTAVATCAVSGFTAIVDRHTNAWNKVLLFEGDSEVWLRRNPTDKRHMHSHQILVFRPDATVLPQPMDFNVCKAINDGLLFTGFKNKLPSWPQLLAECQNQQSQPTNTTLIDPTNQDSIDQAINSHPEETPPPVIKFTPPPEGRPR